MRDADAAITSAFYDHEQELARDREDRADDWGADSVFASHPRRRFGRRATSGDGQLRRHPGARPMHAPQFERRVSGPVAAPIADPWQAPDEDPVAAEEPRPPVPAAAALTLGVEWSDAAQGDEPPAAAEPAGRRTVVVTGRPGAVALAPSPRPLTADRRRPRRRPVERLGARPDRVAGWAFALGMLLILVAVGTADAAPL